MIRLLAADADDPPPVKRLDAEGLRTLSSVVTCYLTTHPGSVEPEELLELIAKVRDAALGRERPAPVVLKLLQ